MLVWVKIGDVETKIYCCDDDDIDDFKSKIKNTFTRIFANIEPYEINVKYKTGEPLSAKTKISELVEPNSFETYFLVDSPALPRVSVAQQLAQDTNLSDLSIRAIMLASQNSCKTILEDITKEFIKEHKHQNKCNYLLHSTCSTTSIFRHMVECVCITSSNIENLDSLGLNINLATRPNYSEQFVKLCKKIDYTPLLSTDDDKYIVPSTLHPIDKSFMISYLVAKGNDLNNIVIFRQDGILLPLDDNEISKKRKSQNKTSTSKKSKV